MLEEMVARQPPSAGSRPVAIGSRSIAVSLQPAIPRRVAPQQSPLPLHRSPTIVAQSRSGEAVKCAAQPSLQGCSPAFCCDRPVAPGTSAANGVSPLLCAPGVISILRRHAAVVKLTPSHAMRSPQGAWTPRPAAADAAASPAPRRLDRQMAKAEIAAGVMSPLRPPQRGERNHTLLARRRECRLRPSRPRRRRTQRRRNRIRIIL